MVLQVDYVGNIPSVQLTGGDNLYELLSFYESSRLGATGFKTVGQTNSAYALHIKNRIYKSNSSKVFLNTGFIGLDCTNCSHLSGQIRADLSSIKRVELFAPEDGITPAFDIEILVHFASLSITAEWFYRVDTILLDGR